MSAKLIIGLGNPGPDYADTYHNVGLMALAYLVRRHVEHGTESDRKSSAMKYFESVAIEDTAYVLPLVFMNESGLAAREAMKIFKANPDHLIVLHDESDLPIGEYKVAFGGGSAGHKGVQSIIDHIGTGDFWRVRIGIRNPKEHAGNYKRKKAGDFVLNKISTADKKTLEGVFKAINERNSSGLVE